MGAVASPDVIPLSREELFRLCAVDGVFYSRTFFPKTFRQGSPAFHRDFWAKVEDPAYDFFAAEVFRGAGKTTLARSFISKRIAFGLTRNTLAVAISESMVIHTVTWWRYVMRIVHFWHDTTGTR